MTERSVKIQTMSESSTGPENFIADIVRADVAAGKHGGHVVTRFPPAPTGFLHIGHAKAICVNFGIAQLSEYGRTNLRFDDTDPTLEEPEYVDAIRDDVRWLGFEWDGEHFASDYFEQLYEWAVDLVKRGLAYVDSQTLEEIRRNRGDYYRPGVESPFRERRVDENLDLFVRMRAGEFVDGEHVLRAKIDMRSPDILMRDPLMYRIRHVPHQRTGTEWPIYPLYDWAHGLSDAIEGVTHSLCSLEFANNRPLYDWFVGVVDPPTHPRQIEFARLNLSSTVLSKRRLGRLVEEGVVDGWDDPRMPTIAGMRRRGYTPEAIRDFSDRIGVARRDNVVDIALLEHTVREHLNATSPRVMGVIRPLRVVIENYPEGESEEFDAPYMPDDPTFGSRRVPFGRVLYVERDDYMDDPPKKWFRLAPGREVRLRYACLITCKEAVYDDNGELVELRCEWDPESRGGSPPDGRKVKGTLHWVSAAHAVDAEVRLYDRLFDVEDPLDAEDTDNADFLAHVNPESLTVLAGAKLEPSMASAAAGARYQLERLGYFVIDTGPEPLVLNRTIGLRDTWAKIAGRGG